MKVLFVSHVANFQKFSRPYMKWFIGKGWMVHYASMDDEKVTDTDFFHKISFRRSPLNPMNIKAFFQIVKLYRKEKFDIVHCHTPVGGIIARMAAVFFPKMKVIYTVHGFHFFKGAPLQNQIIYKNVERLLARRADAIVTVNKEDYEAAKRFRLHKNGRVYHINGVGVDINHLISAHPTDRNEFNIPSNAFVVLTVAELIKRKNYPTAIKAFAKADIPNSYYIICGNVISDGMGEFDGLKKLVESLGISDRVIFAGYRKDIPDIIKTSDVFLFPSYQEGLSVAIIEAMAGGLPVVASKIRGNTELVEDNGFLCDCDDIDGFADALRELYENNIKRKFMSERSVLLSEKYDISNSLDDMSTIYLGFM